MTAPDRRLPAADLAGAAMTIAAPLLDVSGLTIGYPQAGGHALAVNDVSFTMTAGERVGVVGESGSGKSTLALALMQLLPPAAAVLGGRVALDGIDLMTLTPGQLRALRGAEAGMVFQNPMTSFDPLRTLGDHLAEGLRAHGVPGVTIPGRVLSALRQAELPQPGSQSRRHPHELSGGMRQRGLIALAIANEPRLLIADEPTTALDVTIQAQILDLFGRISGGGPGESGEGGEADRVLAGRGLGLLLVSHNLGVVRQVCSRVIVMYGGRIVEDAPVDEIFRSPRHPYTRALLRVTPRASAPRGRLQTIPGQPVDITSLPVGCAYAPRCPIRPERAETEVPPLVDIAEGRRVACFIGADGPLPEEPSIALMAAPPPAAESPSASPQAGTALVDIRDLWIEFSVRRERGLVGGRERLVAVAGVDLKVRAGETLAVVGESGSGKTTLARAVLGLVRPTRGTVRVAGDDPADRSSPVRRTQRIQAVFQDPHGSLDPRLTVGASISEPMENMGVAVEQRRQRVADLLAEVRLPPAFARRYPRELSGGQAQRVAVARALAVQPGLIVLDEPTASLDVSIQGHIVNLLLELQERHELTYLFVSHDLVVVRQLASRIAVMYLGRVMELARWDDLFSLPLHPYSTALLSGIPQVDTQPDRDRRIILAGEPPSPINPPAGCVFHTRCPIARLELCATVVPPLEQVGDALVACHFPGELRLEPAGPGERASRAPGGDS